MLHPLTLAGGSSPGLVVVLLAAPTEVDPVTVIVSVLVGLVTTIGGFYKTLHTLRNEQEEARKRQDAAQKVTDDRIDRLADKLALVAAQVEPKRKSTTGKRTPAPRDPRRTPPPQDLEALVRESGVRESGVRESGVRESGTRRREPR